MRLILVELKKCNDILTIALICTRLSKIFYVRRLMITLDRRCRSVVRKHTLQRNRLLLHRLIDDSFNHLRVFANQRSWKFKKTQNCVSLNYKHVSSNEFCIVIKDWNTFAHYQKFAFFHSSWYACFRICSPHISVYSIRTQRIRVTSFSS